MSTSSWRQDYEKRGTHTPTAIEYIKPGYRIVIGSACGAPQPLIHF